MSCQSAHLLADFLLAIRAFHSMFDDRVMAEKPVKVGYKIQGNSDANEVEDFIEESTELESNDKQTPTD